MSPFLIYLSRMPVVIEPIWRRAGNEDDKPAMKFIGDVLSRIEACRMQISGHRAHVPCKNCHKGNGQFSQCVVVDGFPGITACANCHWSAGGTGSRSSCEWYTGEIQPYQPFKARVRAGQAPVPADPAPGLVRFRPRVAILADIDQMIAQLPPNYDRIISRLRHARMELGLPPVEEDLDDEEAPPRNQD